MDSTSQWEQGLRRWQWLNRAGQDRSDQCGPWWAKKGLGQCRQHLHPLVSALNKAAELDEDRKGPLTSVITKNPSQNNPTNLSLGPAQQAGYSLICRGRLKWKSLCKPSIRKIILKYNTNTWYSSSKEYCRVALAYNPSYWEGWDRREASSRQLSKSLPDVET